MNWVAWCVDGCGLIYEALNGAYVEDRAKQHMEEKGHKVIVGYFVEEES